MKSTMFIVGLFLVAATALRLKQRDCNAPRDAIASCEDMCKVTERDLQIKTNHIQSLSIVTKKDQKVIKSFDQCLAKYVKHHVEEQQNSPKTEIFVRSVALKNAYESVEVLDKAVHEKLQILERVSESKQKIYTMRSNIKKFHDCFSSIDNLAVCKSKLAQEVAALSLRHAKLREYRSQSMADVETETRKEIDSTKRNIDDWTLELATLAQKLEFVEPTTVCKGRCYELVLAGGSWPAGSPGLIHGLWYQGEWKNPAYNPDYMYNGEKVIPANYPGRHKWAHDGTYNMMNSEWLKHGRYSKLTNRGYSQYIDTAVSLFDSVNYIKSTYGNLSFMTRPHYSDTVYCFNQKPGVGDVGMVLVKCR